MSPVLLCAPSLCLFSRPLSVCTYVSLVNRSLCSQACVVPCRFVCFPHVSPVFILRSLRLFALSSCTPRVLDLFHMACRFVCLFFFFYVTFLFFGYLFVDCLFGSWSWFPALKLALLPLPACLCEYVLQSGPF